MLITWSRKFWNATKASSPMTRGIWIIPTPVKDKFMIENRMFHLLKINTLLWRLRRASEAAAVGTPCPRPHIFHSTEFELKKRKMQELSKKCYQSTFTKSQLLQDAAARRKGNRWVPIDTTEIPPRDLERRPLAQSGGRPSRSTPVWRTSFLPSATL